MKTIIQVLCLFLFASTSIASGDGYSLDSASLDPSDKASLQRGLMYYQNVCAGCHSTKYQRYERVANDLGIPEELMMEHIVFDRSAKIGDLMANSMDAKEAKSWFGATPPDLTLVTRVRGGADWLYTYLRTFYEDKSRPYGVNNKIFPDVGMPHVLENFQGVQIDTCLNSESDARDPLSGEKICGLMVDPDRKGSLSPSEFDQMVYDIVNFLSYSAEPMKADRERIGLYVFLFLFIFLIFAYLLKKEYWRDVH